jgi:hypothetical protein
MGLGGVKFLNKALVDAGPWFWSAVPLTRESRPSLAMRVRAVFSGFPASECGGAGLRRGA